MRKIRVLALLLLASFDLVDICAAQNRPQYPFVSGAPDCILVPPAPFTAIGNSAYYDNRNQGCTTWHLVYNSQGFSAEQVTFQSADDSGNGPGTFNAWGTSGGTLAGGTALPLTATTSGQATGYKYRPFVRISIASVTGSGTIWPMLYGYRPGVGNSDQTQVAIVAATVAADAYNDGTSAASSAVPLTSAGTGLNGGLVVAPRVWMGTQGDRMIACGRTIPKIINPTTATTTLLIPATAAQTNRICILEISSTGAQTVTIVVGTQTTNPCDTGQVVISPTYQLAANTNYFVGGTLMAWQNGTAVNQQVCAVTTAAVSAFVAAHYTVY